MLQMLDQYRKADAAKERWISVTKHRSRILRSFSDPYLFIFEQLFVQLQVLDQYKKADDAKERFGEEGRMDGASTHKLNVHCKVTGEVSAAVTQVLQHARFHDRKRTSLCLDARWINIMALTRHPVFQ